MSSDKGVEHYLSLYGVEHTSVSLPIGEHVGNNCDNAQDGPGVLLVEKDQRGRGKQFRHREQVIVLHKALSAFGTTEPTWHIRRMAYDTPHAGWSDAEGLFVEKKARLQVDPLCEVAGVPCRHQRIDNRRRDQVLGECGHHCVSDGV